MELASPLVNFVCVYWGTKYAPVYVENLYNMVNRHTTIPYNFICFTDHVKLHKMVKGDIEFKPLPRHDEDGWWNKMLMYSKESGLEGENLYMDLDVVIMKNIDEMFKFGDENTFGVINDFNGFNTMYNSSIVKFNTNHTHDAIYEKYMADRTNWKRNQGDQNVMSAIMKDKPETKVMPDEWTFSYKWFNRKRPRFSKSEWTFELQPSAKVAVFHGRPDPHESDQEWVKNNWK